MDTITDNNLIKQYITDCQLRNFSDQTIESYKSTMHLFSEYIQKKNKGLLEIDKDTLRSYISYLISIDISYKTIENRFSTFASFYDYLVYEGLLENNIVLNIRKRYIRQYKKNNHNGNKRKLIDLETMSRFINLIFDVQIQAIALLAAKTGIRLRELISIDLNEINWQEMSITLKTKPKRSNLTVFFDAECAMILKRWIAKRQNIAKKECNALFISYVTGQRIHRNTIYREFTKWAEKAGLHDPNSSKLEDHYTLHCQRHWFTTELRRAGMPREFIKELRGDKRSDAMDIYDHIDRQELRRSYLAHIPELGII
jgi:integrase/recombinase XerD